METQDLNKLKSKAAAYCSKAEHCISEIEEKLMLWSDGNITASSEVIAWLKSERYIDEERFSQSYVKDKFRFNKWGRRKIAQQLSFRHIPVEYIAEALAQIDTKEYEEVLTNLLAAKKKSTKANSEYELNTKLFRFAISRGFESEIISRILKTDLNIE